MNFYHMWFNLKDTRPPADLQFAEAVRAYLDHLKGLGQIEGWSLSRRKFGFSPPTLHEFHCVVWCKDLAQLDRAFSNVATRSGQTEALHMPVYSAVKDFTSALYRSFPDPERAG